MTVYQNLGQQGHMISADGSPSMDAFAMSLSSESSSPSVTRWLNELRLGDEQAAARLWGFLSERLLVLAKNNAHSKSAAGYDEEDVALSAFAAFCSQVRQGSYDTLDDRAELWQLIAVIALNKARNRARDENRICRGGKVVRMHLTEELLATVANSDSDPALNMSMQDECQRLLAMLSTREVRMVALLRVEGYTNEEIAQQLGCTRRSVQRRLNLIRETWSEEIT